MQARRKLRGKRAHAFGIDAEALACAALERDGWHILARRARTAAGELDAVVERDGLLAFIEVKSRPTLADAAASLGLRQRNRLLAAAEIWLGEHPERGQGGVRFDVMLVDTVGCVRRVADAIRREA